MPEDVEPKVTANVKRAFDAYVGDPDLVRDLNGVLARIYVKAGVDLTRGEKAALMIEIGKGIAKGTSEKGHN